MSGTSSWVQRAAFENGATPSFAGSAEQWDFLEGSDIVIEQPIVDGQGLTGGRVRDVSRTRKGPYSTQGTLTAHPGAAFFGKWLPRVMGGGTATSPAMANSLPEFGVLADRGGDIYQYLGCIANRLTVSGSASGDGLITAAIDVLGKSETDGQSWGGSIPALGSTLAYEPYLLSDAALTLVSGARTILDFRLVLDNGGRARHANALPPDEILIGVRTITLEATAVFTSAVASALYGGAKDGAAGTLVLTNSTVSTTFSFSRVQIPDNSPRAQGGEVILPIRAQIRGTSWGDEFTVTNDQTP